MATFIFECPNCTSLFEVEADITCTELDTECPHCGSKFLMHPKELYEEQKKAKKKKKKGIFKKIFG